MFKTEDGRLLDVEELTWDEASVSLMPLNSELARIIDNLDPSDDLTLYRVKYPFGKKIIYNSEAFLPLADGGTISFNDPSLPKTLRENLSYDINISSPLGMLISKNCEFYMPFGQRILPHMVISAGDLFGIARILNNALPNDSKFSSKSPSAMWNLNSGTRSSFMLPKITDNAGHNKLKAILGFDIEKPDSYQEHNTVFTAIAEHSKSPWRSEFMFFSTKWNEKLKEHEWAELYGYLSLVNRSLNKIWHNTPNWTAIYNEIEYAQRLGHFSSYALGTARHLLTIAVGCTPGFKPSIDESSLPIKLIQDMYLNSYELTDHWPIIMEPTQFTYTKDEPVYYSLNYPTLAQHNPATYKGKSIISLEEDVEYIMERYCSGILKDAKTQAPSLYSAAANVDFSFYHNDHSNNRKNIKNNAMLPDEDKRFICKHAESASFPTYSPFLKGCIKLSRKEKPIEE